MKNSVRGLNVLLQMCSLLLFFFPFPFPPYVKGGNCNLWVKGSNVILYLSKFMTGYIVHSTNNVYIMINIGFFLVYGVFPHCV